VGRYSRSWMRCGGCGKRRSEERLLVAADKVAAKRHFKEMLVAMSRHRNDLAAYSDKGDAFGVARCKRLLKFNYSRIRKYCAKHDLELPHDVPSEGAG
jgi:hypothetical protein